MSSGRVMTIMTNVTGTGGAAIAAFYKGAIKNIESLVRDISY